MTTPTFARRMAAVPRSFIREILKVTEKPHIISFAGGLPNPAFIPVQALAAAAAKVLATSGTDALQYRATEGYLPLREYVAARYHRMGLPHITPDHILITTGSQQGLDLLAKVLIDENDPVLVERPTYLAALQSFSLFQPRFISISLQEEGLDPAALADALDRHAPKLLYVIPNFQNPSGISYSAERRREIAALLTGRRTIVVEDDPYGELRFSGEAPPPIATHLPPEQAVLLGTFSKTVAPGLRLGWVCAPPAIMENLVTAKQAADLHTDAFSQRILDQYLLDNDLAAQIRSISTAYAAQCSAMISAIERFCPADVQHTRPTGGMFLWVTLPPHLSAMDLFPLALERCVAFVPGPPFHADHTGQNTMRLSFSNASEAKIHEGIERLADAIRALYRHPPIS